MIPCVRRAFASYYAAHVDRQILDRLPVAINALSDSEALPKLSSSDDESSYPTGSLQNAREQGQPTAKQELGQMVLPLCHGSLLRDMPLPPGGGVDDSREQSRVPDEEPSARK